MTIPDFQTLMLPVAEAVAAKGEIVTSELVRKMEDQFSLSPDERAQLLPSGRMTVIANRTHWAVTYLNKTGLLERTKRAHYRLTERGKAVLASGPPRIDLKLLAQFPELAAFRGGAAPAPAADVPVLPVAVGTPDEVVIRVHAELDAVLRQQLIERVVGTEPKFFERLVVQLLLRMGFGGGLPDAGRAIGGAGDGGLDGVIDQDPLGLDRVYIQAKRYRADNSVGPTAIQAFFGALNMAKASKGVFITTSSFTKSAQETAERLGSRIVLIDGDRLAVLMIRYDVGVRIEQTFHIKKIDEDFFSEE